MLGNVFARSVLGSEVTAVEAAEVGDEPLD
jgi:hypothetical protein